MKSIVALLVFVFSICCLPSLTEAEKAKIDLRRDWKLGVMTYSFNRFTFFESVDKTASLGLHYIEAYPGQRISKDSDVKMSWNAMDAETMRKVKDKLKAADIKLIAYGVTGGSNEASWRKLFEFCKDMGIEVVNSAPNPKQMELIDRLCQEYKISVAIHNHPRPQWYKPPRPMRWWHPDEIVEACKGLSKWVGACPDTGHWIRSGLNPVQALRKLEGRIISFHFKDLHEFHPRGHDTIWGKGQGNVRGMLAELKRQGFKGPISIEYEYNWSNSVPDMRQCVAYFNKVVDELEAEDVMRPKRALINPRRDWRLGMQAWSFNRFTLYEAIDKTAELGLHWLEAYPGQTLSKEKPDVKFGEAMSPQIRKEVKRKLAQAGVKLINMGVVGLSNNEKRCRRTFEFAKDMGIETLTAEPAEDAFDLIDKLCQEYRIKVAIHNHPRPSYYKPPKPIRWWNPDQVLEACKGRSKWIGACADTGHWMRSGINPVQALRKLRGRIISFHLKDLHEFHPKGHDTIFGKGQGNVRGMLEELYRQNFKGVVAIEYEYNMANSMPEIRGCVEYFNKVAGEL